MRKVFHTGTHRVRHPDDTLTAILPLLPDFGVTRLADVTGLDDLNIPVVMSVRPTATTLSVSQGKGTTLTLARISAAMEAIELWHAERAVPAVTQHATSAAALDLSYDVTGLEQHPGSLLTQHTRLDWIPATILPTGQPTLVPVSAVHMGQHTTTAWRPYLRSGSSNGLASGNTIAEATIHACYEAIERDATSILATSPIADRDHLDPASVVDDACRSIIDRIHAACAWLELVHIPNRWQIPCFACYLWRDDTASCMVVGSGAHSDPAVALSRAITEAVQSRLTFITGTRDDIHPAIYTPGTYHPPASTTPTRSWPDITAAYTRTFDSDDAEATWLAEHLSAGGSPPLRVVLADRPEFAVVKVLCPGLAYTARHEIPRPVGRAARNGVLGGTR
ncbi:YcaO-like family protein [Dactylosporangium sp. NPDC005555]|uniref:YcaO-like family protein n=1 Tax=Dactylosporangium sp. NPDC005555 TaxID=3154889 RepID=UPI0033B65524